MMFFLLKDCDVFVNFELEAIVEEKQFGLETITHQTGTDFLMKISDLMKS
jgi:hypothetical protein